MKIKFLYISFIFLLSGCNEFIDLTGKFINRLNDPDNQTFTLNVSVINGNAQFLPNFLVSIIDDQDSLLLAPPKFTGTGRYLVFSFPDELVRTISPGSQNLIIVVEHPDFGVNFFPVSISCLKSQNNSIIECFYDIQVNEIERSDIDKYSFYFEKTKNTK